MKILKLMALLFVCSMQAQDYKLGKVTVDELKEKRHPTDSSASAAILYKKAYVWFTLSSEGYWNVITETEVKIKIYKKDAYDLANVEKIFYWDSNQESVKFNEAATYNLVDGKVEKTKLKSEGEFTELKNKYYKAKKISLPNVKEGSVIEYKITQTTGFIAEIPSFYFQYDIPVNYIQYAVHTPISFIYNGTLGGYLAPKQTEKRNVPNGEFQEDRVVFTLENVKALKDESYVNNINNYRSRITYELSSRTLQNGGIEKYATNWEAVTKKIYDNENFGRQLERNNYFENDINALIAGVTDRDQKIKLIFNHVQSRMHWNDFLGYNCDQGVKSAYVSKTGNAAEINLMLVAMLRHADIDANPVLVSTRSNGITIFPSRTAYNYVIAAVELNNDVMLLDATSKNSQPNILPMRALNWMGRIIRKTGTSAEVNLMPKINSKETINLVANIDAEGKVSGKIRDQYADYNAFHFRENYLGLTKDSYLEKLEKRYTGLAIDEYSVTNDKELTKPVVESYGFTHDNIVERIGDKMYFSPMMFFTRTDNPFKQEVREFPVDFSFPFQDKYSISITIPDGYAVESLPKPVVFNMEDNIGVFKYNISNTGKQIQLSVVNEINKAIVGPEFYETLKTFFKEMVAKQNEKIVLKKA